MKKHAYLIMAHNEQYILERLLQLLDDKRNDIYVHIDKKSKCFDIESLSKIVKKSHICFIERRSIKWGDYSMILCELDLLKTATEKDKYAYYHFISGVDFPLKTQNEIHSFFDKNEGKEFVHFAYHHKVDGDILARVKYYRLFSSELRDEKSTKGKIFHLIDSLLIRIQKLFHIRRDKNQDFYFGANWFSITDNLARYVLAKRKDIEKRYKHTLCADEIFLQSLLVDSPYYNNLYKKEDADYSQIMRYIDWKRGNPYTFRKSDYRDLINSNMLFARKFSTKLDKEIINMLYDKLRNDENGKS